MSNALIRETIHLLPLTQQGGTLEPPLFADNEVHLSQTLVLSTA